MSVVVSPMMSPIMSPMSPMMSPIHKAQAFKCLALYFVNGIQQNKGIDIFLTVAGKAKQV